MDNEEESHFRESRKDSKKQRKLLQSKDRSKYKKTDKDKRAKQKRASSEIELVKEGELLKGKVLSITSQGIIVEHEDKLYVCVLRGALKKEKTQAKNLITVGDTVLFEKQPDEEEGWIVKIEPRYSILSRADNLSRRKEQVLAANIDQVLITVSVVSPALKPYLVDRYIIAAQRGNMHPVIVINKVDLLNQDDSPFIEDEKALFEEFLRAYKLAGILVIPVSVKGNLGIDLLKEVMKNKTSVFSGQSGVGKSSLINKVANLDLPVRDIVSKTKKGAHTTTTANLIPLEFGGWCIDTPGIRSFGVWELKKEEVQQYFSEIFRQGKFCKFPDCTHTHEQECAVMMAVEKGDISPIRYESYCALMESVAAHHYRR